MVAFMGDISVVRTWDRLGPDVGDGNETRLLARIATWTPHSIDWGADDRHAEAIIREWALQSSKSVVTPGVEQQVEGKTDGIRQSAQA